MKIKVKILRNFSSFIFLHFFVKPLLNMVPALVEVYSVVGSLVNHSLTVIQGKIFLKYVDFLLLRSHYFKC